EGPIVDRFRLLHFAIGPRPDLVGRSDSDPHRVERHGVARLFKQCVNAFQGDSSLTTAENAHQQRSQSLAPLDVHPEYASGPSLLAALLEAILSGLIERPHRHHQSFALINSTSRPRLCSSLTSTLKDSGKPGSRKFSPF